MRILLDENVPVQLRQWLIRHEVSSVNDRAVGWKNIKNGRLLAQMDGRFDILVTADRNIYAQQNLTGRSISIIVIPTNRLKEVIAMAPILLETISSMNSGSYAILSRDGSVQTQRFDDQA